MAESKTVARPYAKAIFADATDDEQKHNWQMFLHTAKAIMQTDKVFEHLTLPGFNSQMQQWLDKLLQENRHQGINSKEQNLLRLLQKYNRMSILPDISDIYDELFYNSQNICMVKVRSAQELSPNEKQELEIVMRKITGRNVLMEISEDTALLAGVLIEYDGLVIDQTLKGRITEFARQLDD